MELSPLSVYKQAVAAVPSIKYALGVAGVIAAAMISYNLASEDPKKAILGFIFVLAGMYLVLIFASAVKSGAIGEGPVVAIVWAVTFLFIACLALTLSAFAIGLPSGWATLVGAAPSETRVASAQGIDGPTTSSGAPPLAPQVSRAPSQPAQRPSAIAVRDTFEINDSSDDCGIDRARTVEYCLAAGARMVDWAGPQITSANCGSTISNVRRADGKENCVAVDVLLRGCGYDNILGIKNCKGRGWIGGTILLNGERPST